MSIIDEIVRISKDKNIPQSDLCKALGINSSTFSTWKKRGTTPPVHMIPIICKVLGIPNDYFLRLRDDDGREAESLRLYKLLRFSLGELDSNLILDVLGIDDEEKIVLSEANVLWVSLKCRIPGEYITECISDGIPNSMKELYSVIEQGIESPYMFDYAYYVPDWWDNGITKEVYEKRATFSKFEQEVIECEFKYLSKKYSDAQELSWVKEFLNENTVTEPDYRNESKPTANPSEKAFIDMFNRLTDIDKGRILERMDMLFDGYPPEIKGRVS